MMIVMVMDVLNGDGDNDDDADDRDVHRVVQTIYGFGVHGLRQPSFRAVTLDMLSDFGWGLGIIAHEHPDSSL